MKVVLLGDLHLIAQDDPLTALRPSRRHFIEAWPSFRELAKLIRRESPDLIVSLGDIVDWYSPQNRDFGIELLSELDAPWLVTPGNHDYEVLDLAKDTIVEKEGAWKEAEAGWLQRGIELDNRVVEAGDFQIVLMDSALSSVRDGTREWLGETLAQSERNLLLTHVPLNLPSVAAYIHSVDPKRSLKKYVQSGAPGLFEECLKGRVEAVFSGHLHFPGRLAEEGVDLHLCPLSVASTLRPTPDHGSATVLTFRGSAFEMKKLSIG